jgi:hypothetical protein
MIMFTRVFLFFIFFTSITHSQEVKKNEVKIGDGNTFVDSKIESNILVDNSTTIYSTTKVDEVINLTPLFRTIENFVDNINIQTAFKTDGLKKEYSNLKIQLQKISSITSGNHISKLDEILKSFLSLYINALKNGAITENSFAGDAFILFSDYQKNKENFDIKPLSQNFYLEKTKESSVEKKQNVFIYPYKNGVAKVRVKNKYGLIDIYGKLLVKIQFDEVRNFSSGYAVCYTGKFVYIYDREGVLLKNNEQLHVSSGKIDFSDYNNGWFRVNGYLNNPKDGQFDKYGYNYMDKNLMLLDNNKNFNLASDFCGDYAYAKVKDSYVKLNSSGKIIKILDSTIQNITLNKSCLGVFKYLDTSKFDNYGVFFNVKPNFNFVGEMKSSEGKEINYFRNRNYCGFLIEIDSIKDNSVYAYHIKNEPISEMIYSSIVAEDDVGNYYSIIKDNNEKTKIGPLKSIVLLDNDYFFYSSSVGKVLNYCIKNPLNKKDKFDDEDNNHKIYYFNDIGIIKPDSQVILSPEYNNYNFMHSYNSKLFVLGQINYMKENFENEYLSEQTVKSGLFGREKKKLIKQSNLYIKNFVFIKYGLINNSGIEVLKPIYDDIKLLTDELVRVNLNGKEFTYLIDMFGNATIAN